MRSKIAKRNLGVCHERALRIGGQINLEAIFQKEWNRKNTDQVGVNGGLGTAQLLFCVSPQSAESFEGPKRDDIPYKSSGFNQEVCIYKLTLREQKIIATVIQWLGTNCGFAFILECLQEGGYNVVSTDKAIKFGTPTRYDILKHNCAFESIEEKIRDFQLSPDIKNVDQALNGEQKNGLL